VPVPINISRSYGVVAIQLLDGVAAEIFGVISSYGTVLEKNRPEVRRGGFWYFVAMHASALFLYVFFIVHISPSKISALLGWGWL